MKVKFNIDKFKISLKSNDNTLFDFFLNNNNIINKENFYLRKLEVDNTDEPKQIITSLCFNNSREIGKLILNKNNRYNFRHFLTFENRFLYSSKLNKIPDILESLGLELDTITQIEIAKDVNYNIYQKINKLIKEPTIKKIINGKKINQGERIERYIYYPTTTDRIIRNEPTWYFKPLKKHTMEIRAYNKTKEINNVSGKEYIKESNGFTDKENIYRAELTLYWDILKSYLNENNINLNNDFILNLTDVNLLKKIYSDLSNRIIRFITPQNITLGLCDL